MQREKNFSGFLGQTMDLVGANLVAVAIFVAVLAGVNTVGLLMGLIDASESIAGLSFGFSVDAADGLGTVLFEIGALVLTFVASYFLIARYLESAGRLHDRGTRIWAYVGLSILSMVGFVLGLFLLIVPGIILMVRWSASSGFLIGARTGVADALSQSWDATRGHSWPIFGAGFVLILSIIIIAAVFGGIAGLTQIQWLIAVVSSIAEAASNAFVYAFGIGVYLLVHDDSVETADVFS